MALRHVWPRQAHLWLAESFLAQIHAQFEQRRQRGRPAARPENTVLINPGIVDKHPDRPEIEAHMCVGEGLVGSLGEFQWHDAFDFFIVDGFHHDHHLVMIRCQILRGVDGKDEAGLVGLRVGGELLGDIRAPFAIDGRAAEMTADIDLDRIEFDIGDNPTFASDFSAGMHRRVRHRLFDADDHEAFGCA